MGVKKKISSPYVLSLSQQPEQQRSRYDNNNGANDNEKKIRLRFGILPTYLASIVF